MWNTMDTCPKSKRVLVWTGQNMYVAEWVKNFVTGDEAFAVADLADDERLIVRPTNWQELPKPPTSI